MSRDRRKVRNLNASLRQRLLNYAKDRSIDFNRVLQRYTSERFLYRLGESELRERFVLKGALLMLVWEMPEVRPTRDIDLLGFGGQAHSEILASLRTICGVDCMPDGVHLGTESMHIEDIGAVDGYGGVRTKMPVDVLGAKIIFQVDIGFGDDVTPGPTDSGFPVLLDLPAPNIMVYPRATVVAEKFQAASNLGLENTRMKDFWDLDALSRNLEFEGGELSTAVTRTFKRRRTAITAELPPPLSTRFYSDDSMSVHWDAFALRIGQRADTGSFVDVGERIMAFLRPVWDAISSDRNLPGKWRPGGPWK